MKCKYCGCSDKNCCNGGCYWIANEVCSKCRDRWIEDENNKKLEEKKNHEKTF